MKGLISLVALVVVIILAFPFVVIGMAGRFIYASLGIGAALVDEVFAALR